MIGETLVQQTPKLNQLNELSLLLPLPQSAADSVTELNTRWRQCSDDLVTRQQQFQAYILSSMNLKDKYDQWNDWLNYIEPLLAPVSCLSERALQQRTSRYELYHTQLPSKQQILDSIVTEGGRVQESSERDTEYLQEQWARLQTKIADSHDLVKEIRERWNTFNILREKLSNALTLLDAELQMFSLSKECHISLCEKIPALKAAFERHQQVAQLMRQIGQRLLAECDETGRGKITGTMHSLHSQWQSVLSKLISQSEESNSVISTWRQLEAGFVSFNKELKSVRHELLMNTADHHDGLQDQRMQCDLLDTKVTELSTQCDQIRHDLGRLVSRLDDLDSLHHRIDIYSALLEETRGQVSRRRTLVDSKLAVWSEFMRCSANLLNEMEALEKKYLNDERLTIEDLLDRIQVC